MNEEKIELSEDDKDFLAVYKEMCKRGKQLQTAKQENEKLRKANDEKNEFLQKLGINSGGEFNRIKTYINKIKEENEKLKETACIEDCYFKTEKEAIAKVYIEAEQDIEYLTQQNKQMREALENVKFEAEFNGNDESLQKIINIVDNTLKGGE